MSLVSPIFIEALQLKELLRTRRAVSAVIGLGYVGLPLAVSSAQSGFKTIGLDIDHSKIAMIDEGHSYIGSVRDEDLVELTSKGLLESTTDYRRLADADVIVICVPTPLTKYREPDLSFLRTTGMAIASNLRRGQLVILESTSWPGTTKEVLEPILGTSGLRSGMDFFLAFSPEREDPGNPNFTTRTIPKVCGGYSPACQEIGVALYSAIVEKKLPKGQIG